MGGVAAIVARFVTAAALGTLGFAPAPGGVEVAHLDIRYSRFMPSAITVEAGTTVAFVVRNSDPIAHEFIVGPADVHERHEKGTEREHGAVPGEVSIPADATATTMYTFEDAGRVVFACHLPGHLDYGMTGVVTVVP